MNREARKERQVFFFAFTTLFAVKMTESVEGKVVDGTLRTL
jgi:hypothetical protein